MKSGVNSFYDPFTNCSSVQAASTDFISLFTLISAAATRLLSLTDHSSKSFASPLKILRFLKRS